MLCLGAAAAIVSVAIGLAIFAYQGRAGTDEARSEPSHGADVANVGGASEPPSEFRAVRDSLPLYPGAVPDAEVYTGGQEASFSFWTKDTPSEVISFFEREIPIGGWNAIDLVKTSLAEATEKDPAPTPVLSQRFERGSFQVTVSAGENFVKDPERGTTWIAISIQQS